jgi:hypothetical protein
VRLMDGGQRGKEWIHGNCGRGDARGGNGATERATDLVKERSCHCGGDGGGEEQLQRRCGGADGRDGPHVGDAEPDRQQNGCGRMHAPTAVSTSYFVCL